jgi:hypothetical protein
VENGTLTAFPWDIADVMKSSRSGPGKGSGFNHTAFTMLKIAVLAPMPRASVNKAITVKAGDLRNDLSP